MRACRVLYNVWVMITNALILLAVFFNAIMDAVENENISESVFKNLPKQFWYKRESWKYAKKIFGYRLDAWHIAKSFMIICLCSAIYFEQFSNQIWHTGRTFIDIGIDIVIAGIIWNAGFWLFYHKLFKVK